MNVDEAKKILRGSEPKPTLYMPIPLREFADWDVKQPCFERAGMIVDFLSRESSDGALLWPWRKSMLDVGCHTGWFTRCFTSLGWELTAIERNLDWFTVATWLDEQVFRHPQQHALWADPQDTVLLGTPQSCRRYVHSDLDGRFAGETFDVALALSVVMYPFRERASAGLEFLLTLRDLADYVFIDFGGQYAKHLPFNEATAIAWMKEHVGFKDGELLGHSAFERRPMFVFWG